MPFNCCLLYTPYNWTHTHTHHSRTYARRTNTRRPTTHFPRKISPAKPTEEAYLHPSRPTILRNVGTFFTPLDRGVREGVRVVASWRSLPKKGVGTGVEHTTPTQTNQWRFSPKINRTGTNKKKSRGNRPTNQLSRSLLKSLLVCGGQSELASVSTICIKILHKGGGGNNPKHLAST